MSWLGDLNKEIRKGGFFQETLKRNEFKYFQFCIITWQNCSRYVDSHPSSLGVLLIQTNKQSSSIEIDR